MKQKLLSDDPNIALLSVEKNLEIGYHKLNAYLHCNWIGYQTKESIMRSGEMILEFLLEKKVTKVLNDNTGVAGPWHEASEWTSTNWFPRMEQAGLKHFAWIFSPNIFAELSAKRARPASNVVRSFEELSQAVEWLNNVD